MKPALEDDVRSELLLEELLDILEEVLAGGAASLGGNQRQLRAAGTLCLIRLQNTGLDHASEHDHAPTLGGVGMLEG